MPLSPLPLILTTQKVRFSRCYPILQMKKLNATLREGDFSKCSMRDSAIVVLQTHCYFLSLNLTCVKWSREIKVGGRCDGSMVQGNQGWGQV